MVKVLPEPLPEQDLVFEPLHDAVSELLDRLGWSPVGVYSDVI